LSLISMLKNAYHGAVISYKVGIRCKGDEQFTILPNPSCEWCADPFVFEHDGKTYIFAEAYNPFRGRGNIKYCVFDDVINCKDIKWHTIIDEPYHLSYPFIWKDKRGVHIAPESCGINDIHRYDCVNFPDKWEKKAVLLEGKRYADSTFTFDTEGNLQYCFTHEVTGPMRGNLFRYNFRNDGIIDKGTEEFISDNPMICRPGGHFFKRDGKFFRVAQDGFKDYGERLIFLNVESLQPYREAVAGEINYKQHPYVENCIGMHTYNTTDKFEVVDFRIKKLSYLRLVCNLVRLCWIIVKKLVKILLGRR